MTVEMNRRGFLKAAVLSVVAGAAMRWSGASVPEVGGETAEELGNGALNFVGYNTTGEQPRVGDVYVVTDAGTIGDDFCATPGDFMQFDGSDWAPLTRNSYTFASKSEASLEAPHQPSYNDCDDGIKQDERNSLLTGVG